MFINFFLFNSKFIFLFFEGGIGEAVSRALLQFGKVPISVFIHLAVKEVPRSGQPNELLSKYGIDAQSIVNAVKKLM